MAEGVGFEPTVPFGTTVFKTAALNHSAIPPNRRLSENALFTQLCVMLKKLSSEVSELARLRYQTYACGYFFRMP